MIALVKAVRLLGISRHELQRRIHDGELVAPDGMVDIERLRQIFPALTLNDSPVLERIQLIKTTAFSRRVRSTVTPDNDALEIQLGKRNSELSLERAMAKKYRSILDDLTKKLEQMQACDDPAQRHLVDEINRWLVERLQQS